MIRIVQIGDLHLRGTNPRNRIDNYLEAAIAKLRELFALAESYGAQAIVTTGDNFDTIEVANGTLNTVADLFDESPVPIITTIGSHDYDGYNLATYRRTSLSLLERMTHKLVVIKQPDRHYFIEREGVKLVITATPHTPQVDVDGWGYSPDIDNLAGAYSLHIAHGSLLKDPPPFEMKHTLIKDVRTTAHMVISGHIHPGYGVITRPDGKVFVNLGSLTRKSIDDDRKIQAALIEIHGPGVATVQAYDLKTAKPYDQVLDRTAVDAQKARAYAMDEFSAVLKASTGEKVIVDINDVIRTVAAHASIAPTVVELALQSIADMKVNFRG